LIHNYYLIFCEKELKILIITDAANQVKELPIINTGIKMEAVFKRIMLIIKAKIPKVIQISGRKRSRRIGFINKLRRERIKAKIINCSNVPLK